MGSARTSDSIYAVVVRSLLDDMQFLSGVDLSEDKAYILSRLSNEGFPFLAQVLPTIDKSLLAWIEAGEDTVPTCGESFNPSFFRRYLNALHLGENSVYRASLIRGLRQLSKLFYKVEVPFSDEAIQLAAEGFIERDEELRYVEIPHGEPWFEDARWLVWCLLGHYNLHSLKCECNPKHGPGAVSTGEKGPRKWLFQRYSADWHFFEPLDALFHQGRYSPIPEICPDLVQDTRPTSELVAVPKDSRGPRLICSEPLEMQYLQQWFLRIFNRAIEHSKFRGELSMSDQERNQRLACDSSVTGEYATIDLKDASDRVSLPLVASLFPSEWWENIRRLRSTHSRVLGKLVELNKFAPMGSAICFPVEEICFWAIARAVTAQVLGCRPHAGRLVSVFGDDLIVPRAAYQPVCEALESVGLKVNANKCFVHGRFRESCGVDAYQGIVVTPTYAKHHFPSSWKDPKGLPNWVSVHNHLHEWGFFETSLAVKEELLKVAPLLCGSHVGATALDQTEAIKSNKRLQSSRNKRHPNYQRSEVRTYELTSARLPFGEGIARLRRSLISPVGDSGDPGFYQEQHRSVVRIKWVREVT